MYEGKGAGRALFAACLLMVGGILNVIWGIAAIGNSHFFVGQYTFVFGHLHTWGWISLIIGALELGASASLFAGNEFGRWLAIFVAGFAAIDALLEVGIYPIWSLAVFGLSLWIMYGLIGLGDAPVSSATT